MLEREREVYKKIPFLSYKQQLYNQSRNLFRKVKVRLWV